MDILTARERVKTIQLKGDYSIEIGSLPVDECAHSVVTKVKNDKRDSSWLLVHKLMKPCFNIPGIPDGTKALLTYSGDIVFDPLNELGDSWKGEKLKQKLKEEAREQQYKAEEGKSSGTLNASMLCVAGAALILIVAVVIVGFLSYYRG